MLPFNRTRESSMRTVVEPLGSFCPWATVASITEVHWSSLGLRVIVSAPEFSATVPDFAGGFVDLVFPTALAFRVFPEEAELAGSLETLGHGGAAGYVVYRVVEGGWREVTAPERLLSALNPDLDEWLVVSDDLCVNVIARSPPLIREFTSVEPEQGGAAGAERRRG